MLSKRLDTGAMTSNVGHLYISALHICSGYYAKPSYIYSASPSNHISPKTVTWGLYFFSCLQGFVVVAYLALFASTWFARVSTSLILHEHHDVFNTRQLFHRFLVNWFHGDFSEGMWTNKWVKPPKSNGLGNPFPGENSHSEVNPPFPSWQGRTCQEWVDGVNVRFSALRLCTWCTCHWNIWGQIYRHPQPNWWGLYHRFSQTNLLLTMPVLPLRAHNLMLRHPCRVGTAALK
jgi:hypothetical protein